MFFPGDKCPSVIVDPVGTSSALLRNSQAASQAAVTFYPLDAEQLWVGYQQKRLCLYPAHVPGGSLAFLLLKFESF